MTDTILRILEVAVVPVVIALIALWRKENRDQHDRGASLLNHLSSQVNGVDKKMDKLDDRLDNVQLWQAEHEKQHLVEAQEP